MMFVLREGEGGGCSGLDFELVVLGLDSELDFSVDLRVNEDLMDLKPCSFQNAMREREREWMVRSY